MSRKKLKEMLKREMDDRINSYSTTTSKPKPEKLSLKFDLKTELLGKKPEEVKEESKPEEVKEESKPEEVKEESKPEESDYSDSESSHTEESDEEDYYTYYKNKVNKYNDEPQEDTRKKDKKVETEKKLDDKRKDDRRREDTPARQKDDRRRDDKDDRRRDDRDDRRRDDRDDRRRDDRDDRKRDDRDDRRRDDRDDRRRDEVKGNPFLDIHKKYILQLIKTQEIDNISTDSVDEIKDVLYDFTSYMFEQFSDADKVVVAERDDIKTYMSFYLEDEDKELPEELIMPSKEMEKGINAVCDKYNVRIKKEVIYLVHMFIECILLKVINGAKMINDMGRTKRLSGKEIKTAYKIYML